MYSTPVDFCFSYLRSAVEASLDIKKDQVDPNNIYSTSLTAMCFTFWIGSSLIQLVSWRWWPFLWGLFLGRKPDKSLKSFPPCYSQSCIEVSISSSSRNLLQFLQFNYCTVHCIGEWRKPDRKSFPLSYETKLFVHEFGHCLHPCRYSYITFCHHNVNIV
jgi:hypothetical protein